MVLNPARRFILRWAKIETVLALLALQLPFNLYLFPRRTAALRALSGIENPVIDTWFGYAPERVFDLAGRLGVAGRQLYAWSEISLDIAYPLILNLFLGFLLVLLLPRAFPGSVRIQRLQILPAVVLAVDYLENIGIVTLLVSYPTRLVGLAWIIAWATSLFSSLKIILMLACLGLILLGAVLALKNNRA